MPTTPVSTDLGDLVEALKRDLAIPGTFDTAFPDTTDEDLTNVLGDGFATAQLDGFYGDIDLDPDTLVVTPGLSVPGGQLVVIYASEIVLRNQLTNLAARRTYKAGTVEYDASTYATVLTQQLKAIADRKDRLLAQLLRAQRSSTAVHVQDGYLSRALGHYPGVLGNDVMGFWPYEIASLGW